MHFPILGHRASLGLKARPSDHEIQNSLTDSKYSTSGRYGLKNLDSATGASEEAPESPGNTDLLRDTDSQKAPMCCRFDTTQFLIKRYRRSQTTVYRMGVLDMRSVFLGVAAIVLGIVTPTVAADMTPAPVVEDLVAAPAAQWSGFYVGAHAGYGWGNRNGCGDIGISLLNFNLIPVFPIESCDAAPDEFTYDYDQAGGLVGFQAGYNWMATETFLVGAEFSASIANITGELDGLFGGVGTWDGLATATAKAGFTFDSILVYGEAGLGFAGSSFEGDLGCNFEMNHVGPLAGAGVSVKVTDSMSLDLKYQHIWLGADQAQCNSTATAIDPAFLAIPTELRTEGSLDVVKLGLNFQLGNP